MIPINVSDKKMEILTRTFNCQKGVMPFTYLGLPLGLTKPKVQDLLPLAKKVERRLTGCAQFLTLAGKIELANSVLTATVTFHMCAIKVPIEILDQIDKYRKHCIWRGSDINNKKPALAAWDMITRPKKRRWTGSFKTQNAK